MCKFFIVPLLLLLYISADAQGFFPGSYYTPSGEKVTGLIFIPGNRTVLAFKKDNDAKVEKIELSDMKAAVIPALNDSLVVVTEDNKDDKKYLAKFLFATPVTTFYYKIHKQFRPSNPNSGLGAPVAKSAGDVMTNVTPMYLDGNTTRELTKANFIDVLAKDAGLVQKIQNKEFKFKELDDIFDEYKQESTHYKVQ
jgi:hypothetical protein